ncbi:MAG: DUF1887 family CARF protein, partial [Thermodesulfobacteriota bacterium]|nr:DUF1887 family CARF protein [Thermodesulfobacteriota bacterium]
LSGLLNRFSDMSVAVNVTGGNKLMALAVFMQAWSSNVPAFYIDTDSDTLWQLDERSQQFPLPNIFKVKLYLQAYGYRVLAAGGKSVLPGLAQLTAELADDFQQWDGAIKSLNYYANKAEGSLNARLSPSDLRKPQLLLLVDKMNKNKLLCRDDSRLIFADEEARFFANGGWLEQHVFGIVQQLHRDGRIRDVMLNGVIEDSGGTKNEIDILFTARNRLFIIECKTKNMQVDTARVDNMIYKLESLKGLVGGLYGKAMLLSYSPVPDADRKRCLSYNLALVDGRKLKNLRSVLCKWIDSSG